jgi:predicted enzyme related to lactoylglutathione lyase
MRTFDNLDLIVRDVPTAAAFFRDVVGLALRVDDPYYAELDGGAVTIMLSATALVPVEPAAGVILHFQVEDVAAAVAQAQQHGARLLRGPAATDWGTESVMLAGPEGIIVDFYRWLAPHNQETP